MRLPVQAAAVIREALPSPTAPIFRGIVPSLGCPQGQQECTCSDGQKVCCTSSGGPLMCALGLNGMCMCG